MHSLWHEFITLFGHPRVEIWDTGTKSMCWPCVQSPCPGVYIGLKEIETKKENVFINYKMPEALTWDAFVIIYSHSGFTWKIINSIADS